jgi:hypothetical protein
MQEITDGVMSLAADAATTGQILPISPVAAGRP